MHGRHRQRSCCPTCRAATKAFSRFTKRKACMVGADAVANGDARTFGATHVLAIRGGALVLCACG
jgi:hypothetical protein